MYSFKNIGQDRCSDAGEWFCPSCAILSHAVNYHYQYPAGESFVYCCSSCGLEFLRPLPLAEVNQRQMDSVDDAEMFHSQLLRNLHGQLVLKPEIRMVRRLLRRKDFRMLDVGCGTGWISKIWADSGADVTGLEPSAERAALAEKRGVRVLPCYVEELDSDERFDLVVIRHVVEHLEAPATILDSLKKFINPGGLLLVVVPNIDCIGRKLFDTDWTWVLPWHCNFFNPRSLAQLIEGSGFSVVTSWQTPSPIWYPESLNRRFPHAGHLFGSGVFAKLLFAPVSLIGLLCGWGDNLTVLARPTDTGSDGV